MIRIVCSDVLLTLSLLSCSSYRNLSVSLFAFGFVDWLATTAETREVFDSSAGSAANWWSKLPRAPSLTCAKPK